ARIDDEVENHLLELTGVRLDRLEHAGWLHPQVDVLADEAPQHRLHADDDVVHMEYLRLQHLLSAERQALMSEPGPTTGGVHHLTQVGSDWVLALHVQESELREARNDREQVVEVMGDAAGERADGLELLRLPELRFALAKGELDALALLDFGGE